MSIEGYSGIRGNNSQSFEFSVDNRSTNIQGEVKGHSVTIIDKPENHIEGQSQGDNPNYVSEIHQAEINGIFATTIDNTQSYINNRQIAEAPANFASKTVSLSSLIDFIMEKYPQSTVDSIDKILAEQGKPSLNDIRFSDKCFSTTELLDIYEILELIPNCLNSYQENATSKRQHSHETGSPTNTDEIGEPANKKIKPELTTDANTATQSTQSNNDISFEITLPELIKQDIKQLLQIDVNKKPADWKKNFFHIIDTNLMDMTQQKPSILDIFQKHITIKDNDSNFCNWLDNLRCTESTPYKTKIFLLFYLNMKQHTTKTEIAKLTKTEIAKLTKTEIAKRTTIDRGLCRHIIEGCEKYTPNTYMLLLSYKTATYCNIFKDIASTRSITTDENLLFTRLNRSLGVDTQKEIYAVCNGYVDTDVKQIYKIALECKESIYIQYILHKTSIFSSSA